MPDQEPSQPVQEVFLAQLVRTKAPVTVVLTNGVKLQGRLANFDRVCLVLTRDGHAQLIFKKAVSTVMPSGETVQQDAHGRVDVSARLSLARCRK